MVNNIRHTSIKRVFDDLLDHPLLRDLTLEQVIRYTLRFIGINGHPELYENKIANVNIVDYRGLLPCNLISIIQVKDCKTGICLRSMADNFPRAATHEKEDIYYEEPSFKTNGRVIFTSFREGTIEIAYKAIPVDENNFPLLIDDEVYIAALEAYIKEQVFTIKFDTGKINGNVLQNSQQEYAWRAAQLHSKMKMPSVSEMESLTRIYNTMLLSRHHFDRGFRDLGNREYIRNHR